MPSQSLVRPKVTLDNQYFCYTMHEAVTDARSVHRNQFQTLAQDVDILP